MCAWCTDTKDEEHAVSVLMLGGTVVVLDQGRVLQAGPTVAVFHHPNARRVGEVFSDPPMNMVAAAVSNGTARLAGEIALPLTGHLHGLAAGPYIFGVRANHLSIARQHPEDIEISALTELAEVNGSETFIHDGRDGTALVVQETGVHPLGLGQPVSVFLNPRHVFAFAADGALVAAPARPGG